MSHSVERYRDPFGRGEYVRETYTSGECKWCGTRKVRMYHYSWENDDRNYHEASRTDERFCDLDCFRSYHS